MASRVNNFSDHREVANGVICDLRVLSNAFEKTGNDKVAQDLFELSFQLRDSIEGMTAEFDGLINDWHKGSRDAFFAPLKAILDKMEN